jgi:hypothetical protein
MEDDPDVLEFYEQPESIPLSYKAASGRAITTPSTPDFLVLRSDAVQWIEVKPEERLEVLAVSQPNRYCKNEKGEWSCPPGEAVAVDYGFQFIVWNSARTNSKLVRNLQYLDDYTRLQPSKLSSHEAERLLETVKSQPGITRDDIRSKFGEESIEALLAMIASKRVYVDLTQNALYNGSPVPIFPDKATADALNSIKSALVCDLPTEAAKPSGQHPSIQLQQVNQRALDLITSTSEDDLETASLRARILRDPEAAGRTPERTLRRWRSEFRHAEGIYGKGYGYLGLVPKVYLTFDAPSTRSVMMLLRDCVRRWNHLPSNVVIDGGKEFGSKSFETFTAIHEIIVHKRPPAQARFGSIIERYFGTTNKQLFHLLAGNTQNTKNVRQLTKSVNPKNLAVWSLERVTELLTDFCFGHYDNTPHPALTVSPAEKYATAMASAGPRGSRTIPYDEAFRFLTMPSM